MPIYEYRCKKGNTFEVIQRMSDDALDTCEVCGAPAVRVLHAPAVHFKGSGFYNTDYGKKKGAAAGSSGEGAKESKGSDSGSSSESKSGESKSDSKTAASSTAD